MKLKVTTTGAEKQAQKEENVRRGKNAKRKGGQYERDIAKKFQKRYGVELKRTPQSGGFAKKSDKADDYRGDITIVDTKQMLLIHIECKAHKTIALHEWLTQAESDCPHGRLPIVVFHEHGTSNDFVAMQYFDLLRIATKVTKHYEVEKPDVEEWRPIKDFPDYYVSSLGRVKSLKPHNGKPTVNVKEVILSAGIDSEGYEVVVLRKDNHSFTKRIHKLVADEFLSIQGVINHIDGDKTHNWVNNLEKSSYSSNLQHAYDTGLHKKGEEHYQAKLSDFDVAEIRLRLSRGETVEVLSANYGVSNTTIKRLTSMDYRNPQNFHFEFKTSSKWSILKWIHALQKECSGDEVPCLVLDGSTPYVCLSLEDFFSLVEKDKVVGKRVFKDVNR